MECCVQVVAARGLVVLIGEGSGMIIVVISFVGVNFRLVYFSPLNV